jgi:hypothetical protein
MCWCSDILKCVARINKKTPPITKVMRRGRNREEAESLWGGIKKYQSVPFAIAIGYADKPPDLAYSFFT